MSYKVFINPGHSLNGKPDAGCIYNGIRECDIARDIALCLKERLNDHHIETKLFQQNGSNKTSNAQLNEVPKEANKFGANLFISIHMNGFNNESAHGTETWYMKGSSNGKRIAELINSKLVEKFDTYQLSNRGAKEDTRGLLVLRATSMPSVLTEIGFISNKSEVVFIKSHINEIANRLCKAICEYFGIVYMNESTQEVLNTNIHKMFKIELVCDNKYDLFIDNIKVLSKNKFSTCLNYLLTHYGA